MRLAAIAMDIFDLCIPSSSQVTVAAYTPVHGVKKNNPAMPYLSIHILTLSFLRLKSQPWSFGYLFPWSKKKKRAGTGRKLADAATAAVMKTGRPMANPAGIAISNSPTGERDIKPTMAISIISILLFFFLHPSHGKYCSYEKDQCDNSEKESYRWFRNPEWVIRLHDLSRIDH